MDCRVKPDNDTFVIPDKDTFVIPDKDTFVIPALDAGIYYLNLSINSSRFFTPILE